MNIIIFFEYDYKSINNNNKMDQNISNNINQQGINRLNSIGSINFDSLDKQKAFNFRLNSFNNDDMFFHFLNSNSAALELLNNKEVADEPKDPNNSKEVKEDNGAISEIYQNLPDNLKLSYISKSDNILKQNNNISKKSGLWDKMDNITKNESKFNFDDNFLNKKRLLFEKKIIPPVINVSKAKDKEEDKIKDLKLKLGIADIPKYNTEFIKNNNYSIDNLDLNTNSHALSMPTNISNNINTNINRNNSNINHIYKKKESLVSNNSTIMKINDNESVNKQMLSKEMKLLKNRLSARKCREKKKCERKTIEAENQELKTEVAELRKNLVYSDLLDDLKTISSQCNSNEEYEAYFPKYRIIQKTLQSNFLIKLIPSLTPLFIKQYENKCMQLHKLEDSITVIELKEKIIDNIRFLSAMLEDSYDLNENSIISKTFKFYVSLKE